MRVKKIWCSGGRVGTAPSKYTRCTLQLSDDPYHQETYWDLTKVIITEDIDIASFRDNEMEIVFVDDVECLIQEYGDEKMLICGVD